MPSTNAQTQHAPAVPHAHGGYTDPYSVKFKGDALGWNRLITLQDDHRLFKRLPQFAHWTKADHIRASETARAMANVLRAAHLQLVQFGCREYGMNGPIISAGFHDDWPGELKTTVRSLAHKYDRQMAISLTHWRAAGKTHKTWKAQ